MPFFDWWGWMGTGVQSIYAWTTYNRDAFADNVSMYQMQQYQKKNYHIAWVSIARDDIRDMMNISVTRINNYMIVATLILGIAAGLITGSKFDDKCPSFVVFAFYINAGIALICLMLTIMLCVKGQNAAFTNTMKLLTYQVRPENPAEYTHDYMKQAQWVEKNGIMELFRIPGIAANYETATQHKHADAAGGTAKPLRRGTALGIGGHAGHVEHEHMDGMTHDNLEDSTPLESLVQRSTHTWYLTKFASFMRLWNPYDTFSKQSMGLGIIALGHGSVYFALGRLITQGRYLDEWIAFVLAFAFIFIIVIITAQGIRKHKWFLQLAVYAVLTAGPIFGVIAAVAESEMTKQVLAPLSYICHFVFWVTLVVAFEMRSIGTLGGSEIVDPVNSGKGFWKREGDDDSKLPPGPSMNDGKRSGLNMDQINPGTSEAVARSPDSWPTDEDEFGRKADWALKHIQHTVRMTLIVAAMLWLCLVVWAVLRYWVSPFTSADVQENTSVPLASVEVVPVHWPGVLFKPRMLACASGHIFTTDGFRIFELSMEAEHAVAVECDLKRPILDLAATCDEQSQHCRPIALMQGPTIDGKQMQSEIIDCQFNVSQRFLQDNRPLDHFTFAESRQPRHLTERQVFATHGGQVVQFSWSSQRLGWVPDWLLGTFGFLTTLVGDLPRPLGPNEGLRAISVIGDRLWFFRSVQRHSRPAVEARDSSSMRQVGQWALPLQLPPLLGACSQDKSSALVITELDTTRNGGVHQLFKLTFPE